VKESEYGGNITYLLMYENGKMKPVEATQEWGEEEIKENDGKGNFNTL
jgi:hypothetical protein